MRGVNVGISGRQLQVVGQRLFHSAGEARNARILERGIDISAAGSGSGAAILRSAKLVDGQRRRTRVQIGKANRSATSSLAAADAMGEVACSRGWQENPNRKCIVQTPGGANDGGMCAVSDVPGHADARPKLIEVTRNPLRHRSFPRARTLANEDGGSPHRGLRLRIPSAVPAQTVGDRELRRHLPFILPVEAQVGLIVGEKSGGRPQER